MSIQEFLDLPVNSGAHKDAFRRVRVGIVNPLKGRRVSAKQYGKEKLTIYQWSHKLGYHPVAIKRHFERWGNLDRLGKKHQPIYKVYFGKTLPEWHEYIAEHLADGQTMPTRNLVYDAISRGKKGFDRYVAKKTGQPLPHPDVSAAHRESNSVSKSWLWHTPAGVFLGRRPAAKANGLTLGQFKGKLVRDPKNWYKKAKPSATSGKKR